MKIIEIEAFVYNSRKPDYSSYYKIPFNLEQMVFAYPNLGDYHHEAQCVIHLTTGETLVCRSHGITDFIEKKETHAEFYYLSHNLQDM